MKRFFRRYLVALAGLLVLATTLVLFYAGPLKAIRKTKREDTDRVDVIVNPSTLRPYQRTTVGKILLVGEAGSGASLAGDVINLSPGINYIFEPLKRLWLLMRAYYDAHSKAGTLGQHLDKFHSDSVALLDSMLSCGFSRMDLTLLDVSAVSRYPQSAELARCVESAAETKNAIQPMDDSVQVNNSFAELASCVKNLESQCYKHTTLLKVTGLRGADLERLLQRHHDLVIVYVVRDPRGSIWYRMKTDSEAKNVSSLASSVCSIIEDSLSSAVELRQRYPARIAVLKYENLAKKPAQTSKLLYSFLRLNWTDKTAEQVLPIVQQFFGKTTAWPNDTSKLQVTVALLSQPRAIVNSDHASDTRKGLMRSAHAWRQSMPWAHVKTIQNKCFSFMRQLGYELFRYEGDVRGTLQPGPPVQQDGLIDANVLLESFRAQELDH